MPFDALGMLADAGLVPGVDDPKDWDYAMLVTAGAAGGAPVSLTRNAGGFAVLDIKETGAKGLAIVFIGTEEGLAADDALTLVIESSSDLAFTAPHKLAEFDILAATQGVILGSELPAVVVRRVTTIDRYLRALATCVVADDFGACWVLVSPYPFKTL